MADAPLERTADGYHRTRLRYGNGKRQRFTIKLTDERKAQARTNRLQDLARALTKAGKATWPPCS